MRLAGEPKLHVKVISPTQTYFNGPALAVTAANRVGTFDILADHANFFSLLSPCTVRITTSRQPFDLPITQGIVKVKNNVVTMFIDIQQSTN